MRESNGNIWDFYDDNKWIVITTNIGWKSNRENPMGAGIAKDAALYHPELPAWYGSLCKTFKEKTSVVPYIPGRFLLFPTKKFNCSAPHLSWRDDSSVTLINKSLVQLNKVLKIMQDRGTPLEEVGLPIPGCGNGNLDPEYILPLLRKHLDDRFILFKRK